MPRTGRIVLAGYPHHVVQRGHNRQPVFASKNDYLSYLDNLRTWKSHFNVKLYAYCLMTNHVHLMLEPVDNIEALGLLMKRVGGSHTRRMNARQKRTGSLWESRYKSSPIQTDSYFLACCRYIELNPVRAHMVQRPGDYPWSSYNARCDQQTSSLIDDHECFHTLTSIPERHAACYQAFVESAIPAGEWELIRSSLQRGQLTGDARFIDQVEAMTGRRIEHRTPGNQPGWLK